MINCFQFCFNFAFKFNLRRYTEAGLPQAMFDLGCWLDQGAGLAAPDYPAAAEWLRRAADAGVGVTAQNLANMYALGRGRAWPTMPSLTSTTS
jgi:TPR repeat protein